MLERLIAELPIAPRVAPCVPVSEEAAALATRFADANAGHQPPVYFSSSSGYSYAALEGIYRAALAVLAAAAPPPAPDGRPATKSEPRVRRQRPCCQGSVRKQAQPPRP